MFLCTSSVFFVLFVVVFVLFVSVLQLAVCLGRWVDVNAVHPLGGGDTWVPSHLPQSQHMIEGGTAAGIIPFSAICTRVWSGQLEVILAAVTQYSAKSPA